MTARGWLLTGLGPGAIAVVRVEGPDAVAIVDRVFRPHRAARLLASAVGRLRLGRIGSDRGDEVVAVILPGDPPQVEIQGHAGPAAMAAVRSALEAAGVDFGGKSDSNARPRSLEAEALALLVNAPTLRSAEILLDQANGGLRGALEALAIEIEAASESAATRLDQLCRLGANPGLKMVSGYRVALVGRPNVGKSRLMNCLAGFDRSIVSPKAGTTRDTVSTRAALGGWPVELLDTAGLRVTFDPLETLGIERSLREAARADLVIRLVDLSRDFEPAAGAEAVEDDRSLRVATKSDLPHRWDAAQQSAIAVSALRGEGVSRLIEAIVRKLVPDPPAAGDAVPFSAPILAILETLRMALQAGQGPPPLDLLRTLLR